LVGQADLQLLKQDGLIHLRFGVARQYDSAAIGGSCTSTIWIAAILSSTDLGVSPGARDRSRCFSVTCRQ
jgi:hypothetical protein